MLLFVTEKPHAPKWKGGVRDMQEFLSTGLAIMAKKPGYCFVVQMPGLPEHSLCYSCSKHESGPKKLSQELQLLQ
jgi:hypothetical protein